MLGSMCEMTEDLLTDMGNQILSSTDERDLKLATDVTITDL